jgi:hypothetical protein
MPETTTAIQPRISVTDPRQPARSAREQRPTPPTQTPDRRPIERTRLTPRLSTLLLRIQSEYREMPGLKLTEAQARRLWDLDGDTCSLVLTTLLEQRFLKCTAVGTYVRATD